MKPSHLLGFLRDTCFFFEWVTPLCAIIVLLLTWGGYPRIMLEHARVEHRIGIPFYRFEFEVTPPLAPMNYHGAPAKGIWASHFNAELLEDHDTAPGTIISFVHWEAVSRFLSILLTAVIFSLMRRLFDRVKSGETFSMKSVRLIRIMGWSFFTYFALVAILSNLFAHLISRDLGLNELTTGFRSESTGEVVRFVLAGPHLHADLTTALLGLFALALAEVFHQGLLLKDENDLTV
jgi:hypothetical protein